MKRTGDRRPSFYAKIFIPLLVLLAISIFFLIKVLQQEEAEPVPGSSETETSSSEPQETPSVRKDVFPDGVKLCGIDVGGQSPTEALAKLVDAINDYTVNVRLDGLSFPLTGQELGVRYNTAFDLNDYLESLFDGTQAEFDDILPVTADETTARLALISAYYSAKEAEEPAPQQTTVPETQEATTAPETTAPAETEATTAQETTAPEEAGETSAQDGTQTEAEETAPETETEETLPETPQGQSLVDPDRPQGQVLLDATRAHLVIDRENAKVLAVDGNEGYHKDYTKAMDLLLKTIGELKTSAVLRSEFRYSDGEKVEDSVLIDDALVRASRYLDLEIVLSFTPPGSSSEKTVTVDRKTLASFLLVKSDGLNLEFDENAITAYCNTVGEPYSSSTYKTAQFLTTAGHYINVRVTTAGKVVDENALFQGMLEQLKRKQSGTITAQYREAEIVEGEIVDFGGDYVEIDLTQQQVYYYRDGEEIFESPCVSGKVSEGHTTPEGVFSIFAKDTNRYLVGATYRSWVNYFMPFNGGIGLHDATWRSTFGGTRYLYNGSHGCINMPLEKAAELFGYVSIGTIVVVHGGRTSVDRQGQTLSGTTRYEVHAGDSPFRLDIKTNGNSTLTYSSSDPSVCKVSSDGTVQPLKAGTCVITVNAPQTDQYDAAVTKVTVVVAEKEKETEPEKTTEAGSAEKQTTEEESKERRTTEETTEKQTTAEKTTEEKTTAEKTTEEKTTEEKSTEEETAEQETTEVSTTEETTEAATTKETAEQTEETTKQTEEKKTTEESAEEQTSEAPPESSAEETEPSGENTEEDHE